MDLIELARKDKETAELYNNLSLSSGLASTFSDIAGSFVDYQSLTGNSLNYRIQAGSVEVQAKQQANALREQYLNSVGNYISNAARRNINVNSGSVSQNLERSSINLGKDIQRMSQNAKMTSNLLNTQADIQNIMAKSSMWSGVLGGISQASGSVSSWYVNKNLINKI